MESTSQYSQTGSVLSIRSQRMKRTLAQTFVSLMNRVTDSNVSTIADKISEHCQCELDALQNKKDSTEFQLLVESTASVFFDKALHEGVFAPIYAQLLTTILSRSTLHNVCDFLNKLVKKLVNKAEQEWREGDLLFCAAEVDNVSNASSVNESDYEQQHQSNSMARCKGVAQLLTAFAMEGSRKLLSSCQYIQMLSSHLLKNLDVPQGDDDVQNIHKQQWDTTQRTQKALDTLFIALSSDFIKLLTTSVCGLFFLSQCLFILKPLHCSSSSISRRIAAQAANIHERIRHDLSKDTVWVNSVKEKANKDEQYRLIAALLTTRMHQHLLETPPEAAATKGFQLNMFTEEDRQDDDPTNCGRELGGDQQTSCQPVVAMATDGSTRHGDPPCDEQPPHPLESLVFELLLHMDKDHLRPLISQWITLLFESAQNPSLDILLDSVRQRANEFLKLLVDKTDCLVIHATTVEAILNVASSEGNAMRHGDVLCLCTPSPSFRWSVLHKLLLGSTNAPTAAPSSLSREAFVDTILSGKSSVHHHHHATRLLTNVESLGYLVTQLRFDLAQRTDGFEGIQQEWKALVEKQGFIEANITAPQLVQPLVALVRVLLISHGAAAPRTRVIDTLFQILQVNESEEDRTSSSASASNLSVTDLSITMLLALLAQVHDTPSHTDTSVCSDSQLGHASSLSIAQVVVNSLVSCLVSNQPDPYSLLQAGVQATLLFSVLTEDLCHASNSLSTPFLNELFQLVRGLGQWDERVMEQRVLSEFIETASAVQQWFQKPMRLRTFLNETLFTQLHLVSLDTLHRLKNGTAKVPSQLLLLLGQSGPEKTTAPTPSRSRSSKSTPEKQPQTRNKKKGPIRQRPPTQPQQQRRMRQPHHHHHHHHSSPLPKPCVTMRTTAKPFIVTAPAAEQTSVSSSSVRVTSFSSTDTSIMKKKTLVKKQNKHEYK